MQRAQHKREGFVLAPEVSDYVARLRVCEHYRISWFDYDRLTEDDVTKASLYAQAANDAFAAAHPDEK